MKHCIRCGAYYGDENDLSFSAIYDIIITLISINSMCQAKNMRKWIIDTCNLFSILL